MSKKVLIATVGCALTLLSCGGGGDGDGGPPDAATDGGIDSGPVVLCARNLDCANSVYCDGEERCEPGAAEATPEGCLAGTPPCGVDQTCDESAERCVNDDCVDEDMDGFDTCSGDCDDTRADINPSSEEFCVPDDPTDEDCNPRTYGFVDIDMDGAGDARCFNRTAEGTVFGGTDCDDSNAAISPLSPEVCEGTFDENCDGSVDEDCLCTPEGSVRDCGPDVGACRGAFQVCTLAGWGACSVTPASEVCDGTTDEDCDGMVDEGCGCTNGDSRSCQFGVCAGVQRCDTGVWGPCLGADGRPAPVPGSMPEVCDGRDNDCNGSIDDVAGVGAVCGTSVGECQPGVQSCVGASLLCGGVGYRASAPEACNHLDDDCDGVTDNGVVVGDCMRDYPPAAGTPVAAPQYTCYGASGTSSCRGVLTPATTGADQFGAAYASWNGDWTRLGHFRSLIEASKSGSGSFNMGIVITPVRGAGGPSAGFVATSGLPVLPVGTPAVAVMLFGTTGTFTSVNVLEHRGSGWEIIMWSPRSAAGWPLPAPATAPQTYDFHVWGFAGNPRARVQVGGSFVEFDFPLPNWFDDFYREASDYPRFWVGAAAYSSDGGLSSRMTNVEIRRVTSVVNANGCADC